jgi:circadian clock protein KaiB
VPSSLKNRARRKPTLGASSDASHLLYLYVSGLTPRSVRALATIKRLCEMHLTDRYRLQVIDVYQRPEMVKLDQVIAVPTLIIKSPLPMRRLIGDMADEARVLAALGVRS